MQDRGRISLRALVNDARSGSSLPEIVGSVRSCFSASQRQRSAPSLVYAGPVLISPNSRGLLNGHSVSIAAREGRRRLFNWQSHHANSSAIRRFSRTAQVLLYL